MEVVLMKRLSTKRAHFVSFIGSFVSARVFSLFLLLCFLFLLSLPARLC